MLPSLKSSLVLALWFFICLSSVIAGGNLRNSPKHLMPSDAEIILETASYTSANADKVKSAQLNAPQLSMEPSYMQTQETRTWGMAALLIAVLVVLLFPVLVEVYAPQLLPEGKLEKE